MNILKGKRYCPECHRVIDEPGDDYLHKGCREALKEIYNPNRLRLWTNVGDEVDMVNASVYEEHKDIEKLDIYIDSKYRALRAIRDKLNEVIDYINEGY